VGVDFVFDFKNPDYPAIFRQRVAALQRIRENPERLPLLKVYYKEHPADFISDWGCTIDPRNVERGLPALIPFILFPKQRAWVEWLVAHWKAQKPGLSDKSRDMGLSWLSTATASTLCLHYDGMAIGFGSRKEEYVDRVGEPKCLFYKARVFMTNLPEEFRGGFDISRDAPHMRLKFPETGSTITGEAGDNIGRGDRTGIYIVDESAHLEHPQLIEASLSQTTNCRIDISSANGRANPFAVKRFSGKIDVFTFHWRDDPRKDDAWYAKQKDELDEVTLAQEVDIDYTASVEGVLIPSAWVQAAVDAHQKLGFKPSGDKFGALDVADEGPDKNAFVGAHGPVIEMLDEWSGKGSDPYATAVRAFELCDRHGYIRFRFDADGIGSSVRGDGRVINEKRLEGGRSQLAVEPFRGSAGVRDPDGEMVKGRRNEDFFSNCKAQEWWALRIRFEKTFRAVTKGLRFEPDELISIPSGLAHRERLCVELSQPTYTLNDAGKVKVDKAPEGSASPNLADAVMIRYSGNRQAMAVTTEFAHALAGLTRRRR
jgi:hypothetical protein